MRTLVSSRMIRMLAPVMLWQLIVSCLVVGARVLSLVPPWTLWEFPHQSVSVSLGLLLVNRVGHSYERCAERRRSITTLRANPFSFNFSRRAGIGRAGARGSA